MMQASADIIVTFPESMNVTTFPYYSAPIERLVSAKGRGDRGLVEQTADVVAHSARIMIPDEKGGSRFGAELPGKHVLDIWAQPGEQIKVNVESLDPFTYTITGSELMAGFEDVRHLNLDNPDDIAAYFEKNIDSERSLPALMYQGGETYVENFKRLSPAAKSSILYPFAEVKYKGTMASLEKERKQREMASGQVTAPDFTLNNTEGKPVSLSDFKGKWVILDFWGSWCIWCIKGFPELKEAYAKYDGRLEVVGVDCRESQEAWLAGVKKHELPWVNVYNPEGSTLADEYGVQGFPTKAIIDPEGKIRNITTGHDPEFFQKLDEFMAK